MGPLGDAVGFVDAGEGHGRQLIGGGQAAGSRSASANQGLGGQQQHLHLALLHLHREHRIREERSTRDALPALPGKRPGQDVASPLSGTALTGITRPRGYDDGGGDPSVHGSPRRVQSPQSLTFSITASRWALVMLEWMQTAFRHGGSPETWKRSPSLGHAGLR